MKLSGILALLIVYLVLAVKAQQSTSKSTTSKTNPASTVKPNTTKKMQTTTKLNPTTPKTNATTTSKMTPKVNVTTTSKLTTTKKTTATSTLKPSVRTTVGRNLTATTPSPTNIPKFFLCRDTNSSSTTGILLPYGNLTSKVATESKFCRHSEATTANGTISPIAGDTRGIQNCVFHINAAPYQQIRIVCSVILITTPESYLSLQGVNDIIYDSPVVNRTYYSDSNNDVTLSYYFGKDDWISCQWTTATRENTTSLQICRDNVIGSSGMINGTIEPLTQMSNGQLIRRCSAAIRAPDDYHIQLSCSAINMSSDDSYFRIDGLLDLDPLELNQVYFSDVSNQITIHSGFNQSDWFYCNWNIALRNTSPNFQLCRDAISTAANGTVTLLPEDTSRQCPFVIKVPPGPRLQISCSNLTPGGSLQLMLKITGIIDYSQYEDFVFGYQIYTATKENQINLNSQLGFGDLIECNWTTTQRKNTTDFRLCLDEVTTSSSGTIQPSTGFAALSRGCFFAIQTTSPDQQIQMSCSTVNLSISVCNIHGVVDNDNEDFKLVQNRIYTSSYQWNWNQISFDTQIEFGDWIDCKWSIITPAKNATNHKFCRDSQARTANGTIQPLTGDPVGSLRECDFRIKASPNEQIQISCSTLKLTGIGSYLSISGIIGSAYPSALLNRVYYSKYSDYRNEIVLSSGSSKRDSIDCKWTTIPEEITRNSKLCRHQRATMPNGTITPIGMTLGEPKRECEFTIQANWDQQIQFSCSTIRLSSGSYLKLYGMIGQSGNDPAVTLNRVYYSTRDNVLRLKSNFGSSDAFNCTWATIPLEMTSQFKLCRHAEAAAVNGTITPIKGDKRSCFFRIIAFNYQKIQISCSVLNLNSTGSYLSIKGLLQDASPPVLNQVYTATGIIDIILSSSFDKSDTFNCSWTITPTY